MTSRMDTNENPTANIWFRYSGTRNTEGTCGRFCEEGECIAEGNSVMGGICNAQSTLDHRARHCFNDMQFYEDLLREKGCTKVDISSIFVRYATPVVRIGVGEAAKHVCVGIRVVYRQTFQDGSRKIINGPINQSPEEPSVTIYSSKEHKFQLRRSEFLAGITLHKSATKSGGDYVCGITFATNRRKHNFGAVVRDEHIHRIPMDVTPSDMRIVAICGTHSGLICESIGIYAKAFGWKTRGPLILLRKLVEEGRAEAKTTADTSSPPDTPIRWLMDADPGLFRSVLKYV